MTAERCRAHSGSPFEAAYGFCRALRVGDRIEVAGTAPIWPGDAVDADPAAQAHRCFDLIETALGELGASLDDVVRTRMFISQPGVQDAVGAVHRERVGRAEPVATMVVSELLDPRWVVEIEAEAVAPNG